MAKFSGVGNRCEVRIIIDGMAFITKTKTFRGVPVLLKFIRIVDANEHLLLSPKRSQNSLLGI